MTTTRPLTTHEEREIISVHNRILVESFIRGGLSLSCPLSIKPEWDGDYQLVQSMRDVDGI